MTLYLEVNVFVKTVFRDPHTDSWKRSANPEWTEWFAEVKTFE